MRAFLAELGWITVSLTGSVVALWVYIGLGFLTGQGPDLDMANWLGCGVSLLAGALFITDDWLPIWATAALIYGVGISVRKIRRRKGGETG